MPTKENSSLPLLISPRLEGENNREYAYRVLRQNIITLQFAPGQTLSEAELSEKLEMSRTPVHEAVMMLKNEWLVDVQAQRGSSVSMIRVDYLREGFNMRLMLEASIMQQLAGRLTMQQLKPFAACIEAQAKVANTGNYETPGQEFVSLDNDFHQLLYHYGGYDRAWQAVHNVTSHYDRVRYMTNASSDRMRTVWWKSTAAFTTTSCLAFRPRWTSVRRWRSIWGISVMDSNSCWKSSRISSSDIS